MIHRLRLMVFLGPMVAFVAGCTPAPLQVASPQAMQTFSQDFSCSDGLACTGTAKIEVVFNVDADRNSLVDGSSVFLEIQGGAAAAVSFDWATDRVVVIETVENITDICVFSPDCHFTLRLLGSGAGPVQSKEGSVLDGDADGVEGGDYETTFGLLG